MRIIERGIERRTVIEAYAKYDCSKKGRPTPVFATWDWSRADAIDSEIRREKLKQGVLAGYRLWDRVEVTMSDLRECAVDVKIFPNQPRKLGLVERCRLDKWEQKPENSWYNNIVNGKALHETDPLILRPAVSGEFPATWYLEDGSGRGIAFVKNQSRFDPSQTLAVGYVGCEPDPDGSFMRQNFRELLQRGKDVFLDVFTEYRAASFRQDPARFSLVSSINYIDMFCSIAASNDQTFAMRSIRQILAATDAVDFDNLLLFPFTGVIRSLLLSIVGKLSRPTTLLSGDSCEC